MAYHSTRRTLKSLFRVRIDRVGVFKPLTRRFRDSAIQKGVKHPLVWGWGGASLITQGGGRLSARRDNNSSVPEGLAVFCMYPQTKTKSTHSCPRSNVIALCRLQEPKWPSAKLTLHEVGIAYPVRISNVHICLYVCVYGCIGFTGDGRGSLNDLHIGMVECGTELVLCDASRLGGCGRLTRGPLNRTWSKTLASLTPLQEYMRT